MLFGFLADADLSDLDLDPDLEPLLEELECNSSSISLILTPML